MKATPQPRRRTDTKRQAPAPSRVIPLVLTGKSNAERVREITDKLEEGIAALFQSQQYADYLRTMSRFHDYSFRNILLILAQKPDASLVAGYQDWQRKFKRHVRYGETGIRILAPAPYKARRTVQQYDPATHQPMFGQDGTPVTAEQEVTVPCYKVVTVFDVSQTEGEPLPTLGVDELSGDVERCQEFFAALEKVSPVPIGFEDIGDGAHGYYHLAEKRIAIQKGMGQLQTLKTAIHEIAHAVLHALPEGGSKPENRPNQRTREVQAESVAFVVCQHFGLDTSDYSLGYVAGWSSGKELAELKASLATIRQTAHSLIDAITGYLMPAQDTQPPTGIEDAAARIHALLREAAPDGDGGQGPGQIAATLESGQLDGLEAALTGIILRAKDLEQQTRAATLYRWLYCFREQHSLCL